MSKDIQAVSSWLAEWRNDLLRGSGKDPLVNLSQNLAKLLELPVDDAFPMCIDFDSQIKKIIRDEQEFSKNAGVNVLCVVHEVLHWTDGNNSFVSPIELSEVQYSVDKIAQKITFSVAEERFLNPFLEKTFEQKFDQSLAAWLEKDQLPADWKRVSVRFLGNFHYHRFVLLRDFDEYPNNHEVFSSPLGIFVQERRPNVAEFGTASEDYIYPMDVDQKVAFNTIVSGNDLVVEGPPGAGKSQVIANVLFHAARNNKSVVLCSEKRTALAVVAAKLEAKGLGAFCQDVTNDDQAKTEFVRGLQAVWQDLEKRSTQHQSVSRDVHFFAQKRDALALKLERLSHFPKLTGPMKKPPYELSVYPDYQRFLKYKDVLFQLQERYRLLKGKALNTSTFVYVKPFVFASAASLQHFFDALKSHSKQLQVCKQVFGDELVFDTLDELEKLQRTLLHAQILSQALFQKNPELFVENSKSYKKFQSTYKKYLVSQQALDLHNKQEGFKWRNPWSKQELLAAKKSFSSDRFWQSDFRQWKKKFVASYKPEVFTRDLAINAIDGCLSVHDVMTEHQACLELFQSLGILHPEVDIPLILQLQRNVHQDVEGLQQTRENYAPELLQKLLMHQGAIHDLNRFAHHHFTQLSNRSIELIFSDLLRDEDFISAQQQSFFNVLNAEPLLPKIWHEVEDFEQLEDVLQWGEIHQFKSRNPELFHYSGDDLQQDLVQLIAEEDAHFELQVALFLENRVQTFLDYHQIIAQPTTKLSAAQKTFRSQLKSGRALLIKEFNKSRQHKSMRELLSSDAAPWIRVLKPILLFNPLMIAKVLPNEPDSIDVLVFDEASQIPFAHAIPAMFRAKQLAVFGDSQQLSPSAFFLQGSAQRSDLLTESRHFLPNAELNHHYRSRHESLIAFSNRYFYNNRLKVMPARTDDRTDGVFCHFVANAVYDTGQNGKEAAALVAFLDKVFSEIPAQETIGIVAFSEKQLDVLVQFLQQSKQLSAAWENERITLTTLEKVQGDEFDVLLITMGYGKDANGDFALRMGPLNQEGGEKRLNVLFSRARRVMHFFHSVNAVDFGVSENLGIDALKKFLLMHEDRIFGEMYSNDLAQKDFIELKDPFYNPHVVSALMTLMRHLGVNGVRAKSQLQLKILFYKDTIG
jgi:hypothetical protein